MGRARLLCIFPRTFLSAQGHVRNYIGHFARQFWTRSVQFQKDYPLAGNCLVYGGITGFTELTQQCVQNKLVPYLNDQEIRDFDIPSILRYSSLGFFIFAPVLHFWYKWLDSRYTSNAVKVVMKKVILDLVVLGIPLYTLFYVFINVLEGNSPQDIIQELKSKLAVTFLAGAGFWVPAQTINFRYLPPKARILFISLCTFIEVNILAILKKIDF